MKKAAAWMSDYGVFAALALLSILCIIAKPQEFLLAENIRNLLDQSVYLGLIALGMTLVIMTGGIDLSVGSLTALAGAAGIMAMNSQAGGGAPGAIAAGLGACILVGLAAGAFSGSISAYAGVAPFVVTLAGLAAYRSLAKVVGGGGQVTSQVAEFSDQIGFGGINPPFFVTRGGTPVTIFWGILVLIAAAAAIAFVVNKTRFGRYLVAVGANERAAKYSAIDTRRVKLLAFVILGGLTGLSAFFNAARSASIASGSTGLLYELDAIAAVVIGGTSLRGGKGRIGGTVAGVVLLQVIRWLMTAWSIDPDWQGFVSGSVILAAVLIQRGRRG